MAQEILKNQELRKKLLKTQTQKRRLHKNCQSLLEILQQLKKKKMVGQNAFEVLKQSASDVPFELFQRLQKNLTQNISTTAIYPDSLKNFALTLHFHSPKAYRYKF